ncbi:MAG TPA: hypothetical protein VF635_00255 [Propionibacteriaceae bacterium]|jgi:hypothetical protein
MTQSEPTQAKTTMSRRTDLMLTAAVLGLLVLAGLTLTVTGTTRQVLGWAWDRHANILSWYIRPLFLLPIAYFSYKRLVSGIVLTLIALATSIAWFPVPAQVQPDIAEFLAFERAWLTSGWTPEKVLSWTLAVAGLAAVCLAFWKRSLTYGLVVITTLAVGKMAWGVVEGRGTGWAMLIPAIAGLVICNGVVLYAMRWRGRPSSHRPLRRPVGAGRKDPGAERMATTSGPRELP